MNSFPNIEQKLIFDIKNGKSIVVIVQPAFDPVCGILLRIFTFCNFWLLGWQISVSINAKCKYLGYRAKKSKFRFLEKLRMRTLKSATDSVKIGPQTKMKIDFPFLKSKQLLFNIRKTAHVIFLNQNQVNALF